MLPSPEINISIVNAPLVPRLRDFLSTLTTTIINKNIYFCFLRNYQELPGRCGFDLDCLAKKEDLDKIQGIFQDVGRSCGLYTVSKPGQGTIKLLILDMQSSPDCRSWLLFDVQTILEHSPSLSFSPAVLKQNQIAQDGLQIPCLGPEEEFLLLFINCLKKSKIESNLDILRLLMGRADGDSSFLQSYEIERELIIHELENLPPVDLERKYMSFFKIKNAPSVERCKGRSFKSSISKFVFYRLPFLHVHHPSLFVVQGPDGVGKTTTVNLVQQIFRSWPVEFSIFHHISEWKHPEKTRPTKKKASSANTSNSYYVRPALKFVWRFVPHPLKLLWGVLGAELSYLSNVNRIVGDAFFKGEIQLADRYVYDRFLKMHLNNSKSQLQKILSKLTVSLLRKPSLTITLSDSPLNIVQRKNELSVKEIVIYLDMLPKLVHGSATSSAVVDVEGMSPEKVARDIAGKILDTVGPGIFSYISVWEQKYNQTSGKNKSRG